MQPIDPEDPRQPNVQIAASIRAAILTGELEPGEQLPSGDELARFFGVSRMTIGNAIRTLRDEGFVRSLAGSGVYVREQASLPGPGTPSIRSRGPRRSCSRWASSRTCRGPDGSCWASSSRRASPSTSFRVGLVGITLAAIDGADIGRTAALCLLHDAHETRIGDVPAVGRAYVTTAAPEAVTSHQTAGMPDDAAKAIQELIAEYEDNQTPEAHLAHDADKIETLIQAIEYEALGHDTSRLAGNLPRRAAHRRSQQLARAVTSSNPQWWAAFDASYPSSAPAPRGAAATSAAEPRHGRGDKRTRRSGCIFAQAGSAGGLPRRLSRS